MVRLQVGVGAVRVRRRRYTLRPVRGDLAARHRALQQVSIVTTVRQSAVLAQLSHCMACRHRSRSTTTSPVHFGCGTLISAASCSGTGSLDTSWRSSSSSSLFFSLALTLLTRQRFRVDYAKSLQNTNRKSYVPTSCSTTSELFVVRRATAVTPLRTSHKHTHSHRHRPPLEYFTQSPI